MRISGKDIPQADKLEDVIKVVQAVHSGAKTYQEIAKAFSKVERQGRYYRRAAEILGFIENQGNNSRLTPLGLKFLQSEQDGQKTILTNAVLGCRLFQRVLPFLEAQGGRGSDRKKLEAFVSDVTEPVGPTMIPRRTATILNWLRTAGIIKEKNNTISLNPLPKSLDVIDFVSDEEPLLPQKHELSEYQEVAKRVKGSIGNYTMLINEVARERANQKHQQLVDIVAKKIKMAGAIPRRNKLIDLATQHKGADFIFEMKSSTESNFHFQVRKAISQLYEYRYMQSTPTATLVLVIESKPSGEYSWLIDYLINDRGIFIVWDGRGDDLFCPSIIKQKLRFLEPIVA